jgi:hypothetical protein
MTHNLWIRHSSLVLAVVLVVVCAYAVEVTPLPSFSVMRSDGSAVASADLYGASQYVLLYLAPSCRPCDSLLAMLNDSESPQLAKRVVIIVRADSSRAAKYIGEHVPPEVGGVTWYADENDEAYRALQLTGTPELLGVRNGRLIWSIGGVMNDGNMVRPLLRNWTKY